MIRLQTRKDCDVLKGIPQEDIEKLFAALIVQISIASEEMYFACTSNTFMCVILVYYFVETYKVLSSGFINSLMVLIFFIG